MKIYTVCSEEGYGLPLQSFKEKTEAKKFIKTEVDRINEEIADLEWGKNYQWKEEYFVIVENELDVIGGDSLGAG